MGATSRNPDGPRPAYQRLVGGQLPEDFHWWVGLQAAVAFTGPQVLAHFGALPEADAGLVGLGGLLCSMSGLRLAPRRRLAHMLGLAVLFGALIAASSHVPGGPLARIAELMLGAVVASAGGALGFPAQAYTQLFMIALILRPAFAAAGLPTGTRAIWLAAAGGGLAAAAGVATRALARRRVDPATHVADALLHLSDLLLRMVDPRTDPAALRALLRAADVGVPPTPGGPRGRALTRLATATADARAALAVLALSAARLPEPVWAGVQDSLRDRFRRAAAAVRDAATAVLAGRRPDLDQLDQSRDRPRRRDRSDHVELVWDQVVDHLAGWDSAVHDQARPRPAPTRLREAFRGPTRRTRHAARLALAFAVCGVVSWLVGDSSDFGVHSPWMALGTFVSLQLDYDATVQKAVERGVGTTLGGLLIVALAFVPGELWFGWVLIAATFLAFSFQEERYTVYAFFLAPVVVIGVGGPHVDDQVVAARLLFTVAGVVLAFAVRRLAWPGWKWRRSSLPEAVAAQRDLVAVVGQIASGHPSAWPASWADDVRRASGAVRSTLRDLRIERAQIAAEPSSPPGRRVAEAEECVAEVGVDLLALSVSLPLALAAASPPARAAVGHALTEIGALLEATVAAGRETGGVPAGITERYGRIRRQAEAAVTRLPITAAP